MVYQISWDLKSPTADYSGFYEKIGLCGEVLPILKSTWLVSSEMFAGEMADTLKGHIQPGDRFILSEIVDGRYSGWHATTTWSWIREQLNRRNKNQ